MCENGGSVARAIAWGLDVAQASPLAVAEMKWLLLGTMGPAASSAPASASGSSRTWTSDDHREAIEAFFGSRAPSWTGR